MSSHVHVHLKEMPTGELRKIAQGKIQEALNLRCLEHKKSPELKNQNGRPSLDCCCDELELRAKKIIEGRS